MFGRSTASFDRLVEKATSQLLLEPDWDSILQICDCIRQADVTPKQALNSIKRKIGNENPHVCLYALQLLESVVKNCGSVIHGEVCSKEFMEFLKDLVKVRADPVKGKILELIQVWSQAFRNDPTLKAVQDTYHLMKMEGYQFPVMKEADAMFAAEKAPEWKDGEVCHRCRVQFTMVQRKHHCRNCGQVFCGKCSSKSSLIPKFGIEREVRVCDACFEELNKLALGGKEGGKDDLPAEYLASPLSKQSQVPRHPQTGPAHTHMAPPSKSESELQEEEELQLAIALSKSEAETKEKQREKVRSSYNNFGGSHTESPPPPAQDVYATPHQHQPSSVLTGMLDTSDMDPELARYLNRNYWEQRRDDTKPVTTTTPSAPTAMSEPKDSQVKLQEKYQNGEVNDEEQFLNALRSSIEIFVNRMKSNQLRGRSIANDSSVQTLFMTINSMHPDLLKHMNKREEARAYYEGLQDKLAQIRDARDALDALRRDHLEKRRREMEEQERQRQIQMAQKLAVLRAEKEKYLEYQRQLALQRMQEQERELQMRLEQQKQMTMQRAMQQYPHPHPYPGPQQFPQMYGQPGMNYSPGGSVESSPHHQPQQVPPGGYAPPGAMAGPPMTGQAPGQPPVPMDPNQQNFQQGMPPPGQYPVPPPGGYQPPGGYPEGGFQQGAPPPPATQVPPGVPGQAPPQTYAGVPGVPPPGAIDYNAYNMQAMNNALPPGGQPYMPPQGAQGYAGPPPGGAPQPGQVPPPGGQVLPPGGQIPPPGGQILPPGGQQPPPPPGGQPPQQHQPPVSDDIAQLISFD